MVKVNKPYQYLNKEVLFFPSISLPDDDWTYKTLLYYDSIHVIAPESYDVQNQFNELTKKLMDKGIVSSINPYDYLSRVSAYEEILINAIEHDTNFKTNAKNNFNQGKLVKIHRDKFHYNLYDHLVRNDLAKEVTGTRWIEMHESIALFILTFLATVISNEKEIEMATNDIKNINFLGLNTFDPSKNKNIQESKIRMELLNGIMPYTMDNDLDKILDFKNQNSYTLSKFRDFITDEVFDINIEKHDIKKSIIKIVEDAKELEEKLKKEKLEKIFFAGVCGIPVTVSPLLDNFNYLTFPALLFGLYQIYEVLKGPEHIKKYQYLAYVNQKFG
jgi:hypothetical protein